MCLSRAVCTRPGYMARVTGTKWEFSAVRAVWRGVVGGIQFAADQLGGRGSSLAVHLRGVGSKERVVGSKGVRISSSRRLLFRENRNLRASQSIAARVILQKSLPSPLTQI